jgi:beta-glucosidase
MEISAEQFYQLLGGEPKHDKEKKRGEYTVYDSYQDVVNVSMFGKFVRGVVHIGLKIILRGKSERDPAFKMVKMGVEEGNLEGLIATSDGIATPKLIDMLVYNANKKYLQAFKRLLKK